MNLRRFAATAAAAALLAAPGIAAAQADVEPEPIPVNTEYTIVLRLPGGCETSSTEAVRMLIPSGFGEPTPDSPEGWTVAVDTVEGQWQITWEGADNPLPGDSPAELRITTVTPGVEAGYELATYQTCVDGTEVAWDGIENPAPLLGVAPEGVPAGEIPDIDATTTTEADAAAGGDDAGGDEVANPWVPTQEPDSGSGGGFSTIQIVGFGLLGGAAVLGVVSFRQRRAARDA